MSIRSKVIAVGCVLAVAGAGILWGLGGAMLVFGLLLFLAPALDGVASWGRRI